MPMPAPRDFTIVPASELSPAELESCFLEAYSDYLLGPMRMPPGGWDALLRVHGIDLMRSRVAASASGKPLAFGFATPRPPRSSWRLAAMAAVPAARGLGAAPALLDDFMGRATAEGWARVELECFAQNERAQRLYRSRGFRPKHELVGYSGRVAPGAAQDVVEVAPDDAWAWLRDAEAAVDLPYQATAPSLAAAVAPARAFRCGNAQAVVRQAGDSSIVMLLDRSPMQDDGVELLRGIAHACPGATIRVPQILRRDLGGIACERAGLQRAELHQLWMERELTTA